MIAIIKPKLITVRMSEPSKAGMVVDNKWKTDWVADSTTDKVSGEKTFNIKPVKNKNMPVETAATKTDCNLPSVDFSNLIDLFLSACCQT